MTVQKYNADVLDPKDEVEIIASTLTESIETSGSSEDGHFKLFFVKPLEDGEHYYIVAYTNGKSPDFLMITALEEGETEILEHDLILSETDVETVWGGVSMNGVDNTAYATLSFRQDVGTGEMIEIKSINILNTHDYSVGLPVNQYTLEASTFFGYETETYSLLDVLAGDSIELDVVFFTPN